MSPRNKNIFFYLFTFILILDRSITLYYFGYNYSDLDQVVMWNGLWDYSKGVFHEPFFYGQAYNYMLESLLAVPLYWLNVPAYIALPTVTSFLSVLPYFVLSCFLKRRMDYFWALVTLAFPVLLPIDYNFLTTIPRGFMQAFLIIPFLYFPLFYPKKESSITIVFLASSLCIVLNASSTLIVLPILALVFFHNYAKPSLYLKSLLMLPAFILDYFSKQFYEVNSERNTHIMLGLELDYKTFETSVQNFSNHFDYLFPFFVNWGIAYLFIILLIIIYAKYKSLNQVLLINSLILLLLLITFSIPKVQVLYNNAGVFFTRSRLYLILPLLLLINFAFFSYISKKKYYYLLLVIVGSTFFYKNINIQEKIKNTVNSTSFPVVKTSILNQRKSELKELIKLHNIDIIVNSNKSDWMYMFDGYNLHADSQENNYTCIMIKGDRRTWLYKRNHTYKTILLSGFKIDQQLLKQLDYEILNENQLLIKNTKQSISKTLEKLALEFGV